jgi:predicted MFS family arabinose efflux permease
VNPLLKNFLVLIIAMVAGGMLVWGIEVLIHRLMTNHDLFNTRNLVLTILAHGLGAFLSGWIINRFTESPSNIWIWVVALLWTLAGVVNVVSISHPIWFAIADTCIYLPMTILGSRFSGK